MKRSVVVANRGVKPADAKVQVLASAVLHDQAFYVSLNVVAGLRYEKDLTKQRLVDR
jgi:hypothetical protein